MIVPESWQNKKVSDLNIRKKYKVTIIFIQRQNKIISPDADTELFADDTLIVAGESTKLTSIANLTTDTNNAIVSLYDVFDNKKA